MIGQRLGPYLVQSRLGAGGMGEVYRATDTTLGRDVALKVLPPSFAGNNERATRFTREARTLASLNHPNIAHIYGVESGALVMELVEGDDLSAVMARGPIAVDDAIAIARQLIDALETAHEQGIVHRDLKPQNIKIRRDGTVKVLDFGLAKAMDRTLDSGPNAEPHGPNPGPGTLDPGPTMTSPAMTAMGMIIGTAAYMAPEQARGRAVDRRADIWAFGVVLYEILSGRRAFGGDDISITLANVLKEDVKWNALPDGVPAPICTLLRRCLEKDPKKRLGWIGEARWFLDDRNASTSSAQSMAAPAPARWRLIVGAWALMAVAGAAAWAWRPATTATDPARFIVTVPENATFITGASRPGTAAILSPDGRTLTFTASDGSGQRKLWVRQLGALTAEPLAGTEGAGWPFWSPDSRTIGFSTQSRLMRISAQGGPALEICALSPGVVARGGTWSRDNVIVFNDGPGTPLRRVAADGGPVTSIGSLAKGETSRAFPNFLPDGQHIFYHATGEIDVAGLWVSDIDGSQPKRLTTSDTSAVYDARVERMLFGRKDTLLAQAFDLRSLALSGEPVAIADHLEASVVPGVVAFSVSDTGILAYGTSGGTDVPLELVMVDRQGGNPRPIGPPAVYRGLALSPDGTRLAAHRHEAAGGDIWITELATNASSRFTFNASEHNASPVWSPDGKRLAYASKRRDRVGVYVKNADGTGGESLVFEESAAKMNGGPQPSDWTSDGTPSGRLLFSYQRVDRLTPGLWTAPAIASATPSLLVHDPYIQSRGQFSPDGKWIAYQSNETGTTEIHVRPASGSNGKWLATSGGGAVPRWARSGRELFYVNLGKVLMLPVTIANGVPQFGSPKPMLDVGNLAAFNHDTFMSYDVSKDGQHIITPRLVASASVALPSSQIVVVMNWHAQISR